MTDKPDAATPINRLADTPLAPGLADRFKSPTPSAALLARFDAAFRRADAKAAAGLTERLKAAACPPGAGHILDGLKRSPRISPERERHMASLFSGRRDPLGRGDAPPSPADRWQRLTLLANNVDARKVDDSDLGPLCDMLVRLGRALPRDVWEAANGAAS